MDRVQHEFKPERHHGAMNGRRHKLFFGSAVLATVLLCLAAAAWCQTPQATTGSAPSRGQSSVASVLTLEQAVAVVQNRTHGKVLRASQRRFGNTIEYRIKILTPDGHVRVVPIRSRQTHSVENDSEETH